MDVPYKVLEIFSCRLSKAYYNCFEELFFFIHFHFKCNSIGVTTSRILYITVYTNNDDKNVDTEIVEKLTFLFKNNKKKKMFYNIQLVCVMCT